MQTEMNNETDAPVTSKAIPEETPEPKKTKTNKDKAKSGAKTKKQTATDTASSEDIFSVQKPKKAHKKDEQAQNIDKAAKHDKPENGLKPAKKLKSSGGKAQTAAAKAQAKGKSASGAARKGKRRGYCWWAMPVSSACGLIVAFVLMLGFREYLGYRSFSEEVDKALDRSFYEGVCVDNYEMKGFGLEEALDAFELRVENKYRQSSLCFDIGDDGFLITAEELGYTSDYEDIITRAWNYGRSGSLEERNRSIKTVNSNKINFSISRTLYDPEKLRQVTDSVAEAYTLEMKDACVSGFDFGTRTFQFSEAVTGTYVDADALYNEACALLESGGGLLKVNVEVVEPSLMLSDIQSSYGMITSAVTNASSSTNNRLINLNLACKAINGTVVEPGGVFSFNETVGERTTKKGYTLAGVYTNGELGQDIGGGVCQVSTTLWNAAMKADCTIVERHEHSRPVAYVDRGKDATVSWNSQDMKFENTTGSTLYIVAYLREDKRVLVEIYGEMMPDGQYIKIEAQTTRKISPDEPERVYNPALPVGQEVVVTEPRTGYKAVAYRVYYDANDVEIKRELLCSSYYREARGKIEYGA